MSTGGPPLSLSDSGDLALIAVGNDVPIGVDIEQIRADRPVERFAQRFFSPYEREALRPLSGEELSLRLSTDAGQQRRRISGRWE
jgi:phosphopantetheinyl transferase